MKKIFVLCDTEKEYASRFREYIHLHCSLPFEVQVFSDPEDLKVYAKKHAIEILLVSAGAWTDDVQAIPAGKRIVLTGEGDASTGDAGALSVSDYQNRYADGGEKISTVYKYQSAGAIVREVMDLYSAERVSAAPSVEKREIRKIGLIGPSDPGLKTVASILLGQVLAERQATLYCNMEPYSGLPGLLGQKDRSFSDLLYYFRQGKEGLIYCLNGMTERFQGLDLIPPVENPQDLLELSGEEWSGFFTEILRTGVYENLILDIGCGIRDLEEVLNFCDVVYFPQGQDPMARAADGVFEKWLTDTGFPQEKLRKIQLQAAVSGGEGRTFFEKELLGRNGQVMRNLVYEEMNRNGYSGYAQTAHGETGGQRRAG